MDLILKRSLRILDFDIENRPLTYWTDRRPSAEITAIASCWYDDDNADDDDSLKVWLLGDEAPDTMLIKFVDRYNRADIVTGHNIRKHDLPIINGALIEYGMPQLTPKLTSDTYLDFPKHGDISVSQESLAGMLDLPFDKVHMTQTDWRQANRLTDEGLRLTESRVKIDVQQHMYLRNELIKRKLLGPPRIWHP